MADNIEFDSRPNQIPKDIQGSDSSIPLSPQWLLPKPGENKTGMVTGENHYSRLPAYADHPDAMKLTGRVDDLVDNHKKDVFRPSMLDSESGRRDRWRDEERETNSSVRKDRWRDGEREQVDSRRVDHKVDPSGRHFGEARRAPGERWSDSGNRDNNDQRRESKWNTRWGPDDKESNVVREKWGDLNKGDDVILDKGAAHSPYHGKDERDGDHHRPWRPTFYGRGRTDPHHQTSILNKQVPSLSHDRRRGENFAPSSSLGRGRVSSVTHTTGNLQLHGPVVEKAGSGNGKPYRLYYSRPELIDIYRTTDMSYHAKYPEGAVQVPPITQEEPLEPLSLCASTPEELAILKGIEKGDIVSSGAPPVSKDGSAGRNTTDFVQSKQNRLGSKDDLLASFDDSKNVTIENPEGSNSKPIYSWHNAEVETMEEYEAFPDKKLNVEVLREDASIVRKKDDVSAARESRTPGHSSVPVGPWRSSSFRERARLTSDWRESSRDIQNDLNNVREASMMGSPNTRKEAPKWQVNDEPIMKWQPSAAIDREREPHKISQPSPEDLVLYYKDPQGVLQGPFSGSDIITWFESGYFGLELQVRLASAPADSPFSLLGDVMPHLSAKARPPPGFSTPKANEVPDILDGLNYSNLGKLHALTSEADVLKVDPRLNHESSKEAENRFLESLMAGSVNTAPLEKFALSEGMQGYGAQNDFSRYPLGSNSGEDLHLLANRLTLERQRSMPNPYSLWSGADAASIAKAGGVNETSLSHSKLLSPIPDNDQGQHYSQNVEAMSGLQGLSDVTSTVNNGMSGWSNLPLQGTLDQLQGKLDIPQNPLQSAFGINQQMVQQQNAPLTNLLSQPLDSLSKMLTPEKLLNSGIPQDPQLLSLLQQQYLLQLQSQAPVASKPLSLLDMLVLKEQQKQEEQQQLIRQQQHLLSQLLSEHHQNKQLGEASFAHFQTGGFASGNANVDRTRFQLPNDLFQMPSQSQADSQDVKPNIGSESSMHLPHQGFANNVNNRNWDESLQEKIIEQEKNSCSTRDGNALTENANKYVQEQRSNYQESVRVSTTESSPSYPASEYLVESIMESVSEKQFTIGQEKVAVFHDTVQVLAETPVNDFVEPQDVMHVAEEVKNSEVLEIKKSSDKKSKKQKSKVSKSHVSKSSQFDGMQPDSAKSDTIAVNADVLAPSVAGKERKKTIEVSHDVGLPAERKTLTAFNDTDGSITVEAKVQPEQAAYTSSLVNTHAAKRAWKPAPGFKPKSLLEIQQEEQRRAQEEAAVSEISASLSSMSMSTPWAGMVVNSDNKASSAIQDDAVNSDLKFAKSDNSAPLMNMKSQKDDLFWDNTVSKSSDREMDISDPAPAEPLMPIMSSPSDPFDGNDFIDAKDTKKSRKKSKAKNAGAKAVPVASVDGSLGSSPTDKGKYARQMQQQKEVLPVMPSGPSLGDFVPWKEEPASPPAPAWFTNPEKPHMPTSLRDILKEQERKVSAPVQVPTPHKPTTKQPARGSSPSWPISSSPAKTASSVPVNSNASSHINNKVEDDLFWGPVEQPKTENKQSGFPQLGTQGSLGSKSTPFKGGSLNRQKSIGGSSMEFPLSASASSVQSSLKSKKNALTKHSEAMEFKEWCESECIRLVGSKDTSFLEYCFKISRSEAEMLLIENLGSYDPNHEFIDKFLNFKDFLPADVLEIAFNGRNDPKTTPLGVGDMTSDQVDIEGSSNPKGRKKKGKKGKKVSPSVLGFNVVSNRIMMGEIQTVDE